MIKIFLLLAAVLLSSCSSLNSSHVTLDTQGHFAGLDYNSLSASYMQRPTTIHYIPGRKELLIKYDGYGHRESASYYTTERNYRVYTKHADKLANVFNKFLEWDQQAIQNDSRIEKDIAKINDYAMVSHRYQFKTVAPGKNLLFICTSAMTEVGCDFILDAKSVKTLALLFGDIDNVITENLQRTDDSGFN